MTMLSGPIRRVPARRAPAFAPPAMEAAGPDVLIRIGAETALATREGALFLPGPKAMIVSDLHLEKGSSFAVRGQLLPPYDTRATLSRLARLIERFAPRQVVSLGDSFHDRAAAARMHPQDAEALCALVGVVQDWIWIAGNHDPEPPAAIGGRAAPEALIGDILFRHEPVPAAQGEAAGHLHPCARVLGRGRSVRARCFATDGRRIVLPAFGAYAGGLNVRDEAFATLFPEGLVALVLGRERVYPAGLDRLGPD